MFSNSRILIHRLRGVCAIRREGGAARRCRADDSNARNARFRAFTGYVGVSHTRSEDMRYTFGHLSALPILKIIQIS